MLAAIALAIELPASTELNLNPLVKLVSRLPFSSAVKSLPSEETGSLRLPPSTHSTELIGLSPV